MDSETLILSPEEEIIIPYETEQTLIISNPTESGADEDPAPTFQTEYSESTNLVPDAIDTYDSVDSAGPLESAPSPEDEKGRLQGAGGESEDQDILTNLSNIRKVLEERLPEPQSESESESEVQLESEVNLEDLLDSLKEIESYESELSDSIATIKRNQIVSGNNDSLYNNFILSAVMAFWGGFAIYLLFRKIS